MADKNTAVDLKEHFERILEEKDIALKGLLHEKDKALEAALKASEKAIAVAEANSEKWRANANEWRGAMDDLIKGFLRIPTFDEFKVSTNERLGRLETKGTIDAGKKEGAQESKTVVKEGWGWVVGVTGFLTGIILFAITLLEKLSNLP